MTTATITRDRALTDRLLVSDLIDPLPHDGSTPPGLRLTSQFVSELQIIGSRAARLAMLEAYERCAGDQWNLAVAVHGPEHEAVSPSRITGGLLELENTIRSLVGCLVDSVDGGSWIEIRPTALRQRRGAGVLHLSPASLCIDRSRTGAPSIVGVTTQPPISGEP